MHAAKSLLLEEKVPRNEADEVSVFHIDAYDRSQTSKQKRDRPGVTGGLILRIEGGNDKEESCLYLGFARGVACFPLMALV